MASQTKVEFPRSARQDEIHHFKHFSSKRPRVGETLYRATLHAHIRDARRIAGRKLKDGVPSKSFHAGSWAAALVYLTVLESIGKHITANEGSRARIRAAVSRYSTIDERGADALYAFRCALAHGFSFRNRSTDSNLNYEFSAQELAGEQPLLIIPDDDTKEFKQCIVYVAAIGELVEAVWRRFVEELERGKKILFREPEVMAIKRNY